jgi:hypothetical protein
MQFYLFTPYQFSFKFLLMSVATGAALGLTGSLLAQGRIGK